jgi:hypothetical protein
MYTLATSGFDPCDFHTRIYQGEIFKFTGIAAIAALIDFTQNFLEAAFHPYRPQDIHRHYSHAEQAERFANHEKAFSQSTQVKPHDSPHFASAQACADSRGFPTRSGDFVDECVSWGWKRRNCAMADG